ncbi:MAG: hydroxymethylglutaryl-CoA lyase [Syntrophales bacterium]|jgi:hydroxymethylglutaryl-CoA lyase|nr:hydroxymethylglutaryl-CoA lyase [Syntrophales bacterium]MCK9528368.1 hydroxymethylglutaryl-CoA lyase [Syntrophales bacterium]MDX9922707.1 hydroxymethylglutaryl-CoA lyase [Syntrophales bacterium]
MDMNSTLPPAVTLQEVALRDGLQNEQTILTVEQKVWLVNALADCGLARIEVSSFVNPKVVPQMADAEEIWERMDRVEGVLYSALILDENGLNRAIRSAVPHVGIWVSASETHSKENSNKTIGESLNHALDLIERAKDAGMCVRAGVMCAFGCAYEGDVPVDRVAGVVRSMKAAGPDEISLADTAGMANPLQIDSTVRTVNDGIDGLPLSLHLHNTRGLGMVNVYAAILRGVTIFDSSLGGIGGCPFIKNASGNIATEDMTHMLKSIGIETGVDLERLVAVSLRFEEMLGKKLPAAITNLYGTTSWMSPVN